MVDLRMIKCPKCGGEGERGRGREREGGGERERERERDYLRKGGDFTLVGTGIVCA